MRKIILFIVGTLVLMLAGCLQPQENNLEYYPTTMVVSEIDEDGNSFYAVDCNGEKWIVEEIEDIYVGDLISVIMCDMGTPEIYDDEIIEYRYSGLWKCGDLIRM